MDKLYKLLLMLAKCDCKVVFRNASTNDIIIKTNLIDAIPIVKEILTEEIGLEYQDNTSNSIIIKIK